MALVHVITRLLLRHVVRHLVETMPGWPVSAHLLSFFIQLALFSFLYQQRDSYVKDARRFVVGMPGTSLRFTMVFCYILCLVSIIRNTGLALSYFQQWSFPMVLQFFFVLGFIWALTGCAAPLSAMRYWKWVGK
jgi:hypothetical protein